MLGEFYTQKKKKKKEAANSDSSGNLSKVMKFVYLILYL
jgi:hypothetical protein